MGSDAHADAVIVSHRPHRSREVVAWRVQLTHGATLGGHVVAHDRRARLDLRNRRCADGLCAARGATGYNIARQIALRAGP